MTIRATITLNGLSASCVDIRVKTASLERAAVGWLINYVAEYAVVRPWRDAVSFPERILATEWLSLAEPKLGVTAWTEGQLAIRTITDWVGLGARSVVSDTSDNPVAAAYDDLKTWSELSEIENV